MTGCFLESKEISSFLSDFKLKSKTDQKMIPNPHKSQESNLHDGGTEYDSLFVTDKSNNPLLALLYLVLAQSDGPSTPQHCKWIWMWSTISVLAWTSLYSLAIVCLKLDFTNDSSLSLFWYAQKPAAISAVRTISMQQKNCKRESENKININYVDTKGEQSTVFVCL